MMRIELIRIDDRLIHGQILESWIPHLKAQSIVVANDMLAEDSFQMAILSMAVPDRIRLKMVSVDSVPGLESDPDLNGRTTMIVVSSIADAFRIVKKGIPVKKINLGNMRFQGSDRRLMQSFWINEKDVEMLKEMSLMGIPIGLQSVPREKEVDIKEILDTLDE